MLRHNIRHLGQSEFLLNLLSITGYAHLPCLTLPAIPPICRVSDFISSSVDTFIGNIQIGMVVILPCTIFQNSERLLQHNL